MKLSPEQWSALRAEAPRLQVVDTAVVWVSEDGAQDELTFVFHVKHPDLTDPFELVLDMSSMDRVESFTNQIADVMVQIENERSRHGVRPLWPADDDKRRDL